MMKKTLMGLAVAAALGMSSITLAAELYVDKFASEDYQAIKDTTKDGSAVEDFVIAATPGNILGDERDISVNFINGTESPDPTNPNARGVSMQAGDIDGLLQFNNDDAVGGEGIVQWDGRDASMALDTNGLGGIDLWAFGDGFLVEVVTVDTGFAIWIEAYTDDDHFTRTLVATNTAETLFIPFVDLENCDLTGGALAVECGGVNGDQPVDMSNFGAAQLIINVDGAQIAVDLSIGKIQVIPEPGTLSLLGLGMLGAAATGLRRRKAAKTA